MSTNGGSPESKSLIRLELKDEFPPVEDLLNQGAINGAVDALGNSLATLATQYREHYRRYIAHGYYLAFVMRENRDAWSDFCHRLDWNGVADRPKIDEADRALEYVFRIACGLKSRTGRQKASKIKLALSELWEKRESPRTIATWLQQNGGIAGAAKKKRERLATPRSEPASAKESTADVTPPDRGGDSFSTLQILASEEHIAKINKLGLSSFASLLVRRSDGDPSKFEIENVAKRGPYLRWVEPKGSL
ncbi:MAG: hypothetical protein EOS58_25580 [Mesorhizobium sp.]|nr:MAG: hypothetical protein EOS58_25580 [Mesorhizobium sp.]